MESLMGRPKTRLDDICTGVQILCAVTMAWLVIFSIAYAIATNCAHGCGN